MMMQQLFPSMEIFEEFEGHGENNDSDLRERYVVLSNGERIPLL